VSVHTFYRAERRFSVLKLAITDYAWHRLSKKTIANCHNNLIQL